MASFGATAERIATDFRHLAHDKGLDEPHESTQIGSSAMAFKTNPMRSERICSLGRKLRNLPNDFSATFASQWLERTLDDSAIRRIDIPEMFLISDALLIALDNVTDGLVVYPAMIGAELQQELPFIAFPKIDPYQDIPGQRRHAKHINQQTSSSLTHSYLAPSSTTPLGPRTKANQDLNSIQVRRSTPAAAATE